MKHDIAMPLSEPSARNDAPPQGADDGLPVRDLKRALKRGWRRRCPACGGGPLYDGYLTVRERCPACSEALDAHRADDAPAWLTIVVVLSAVAPLMLIVWSFWSPPLWVHWTLWPTTVLLLSLALLPRLKGMVVGLQWARRMAGFSAVDKR